MEGTQIGPYRVLGDLGSGGMGKVYLAEVAGQAPGLEAGCHVALKVIHANLLETPEFLKRFLREADIGRSIEHDNVVRCFDCDAVPVDGVPQQFLVMEYVEGQTLRELLQDLGRVPEELCLHIGREVATGLHAIHDKGIVHRDLKPENVLITADHVVKVMDLGVAKLKDEALRLSRTGQFIGSLHYAAPEQFRSKGEDLDGRADLHALGVVLYELAAGKHPYEDDAYQTVIHKVLNEAPRPVSELNPQVSPFFEAVVERLLLKDREERFESAAALVEVLDAGEAGDWWREQSSALRAETRRPLRRIRIPRETALYGREAELGALHEAFLAAKAGSGQVVLLEGEAGVGKTRLVDELLGALEREGEGVDALVGTYPPGGAATAAGAFVSAFRERLGTDDLEATLADLLGESPLVVPAFGALLRGEGAPTGSVPLTKDALQSAFIGVTRSLAQTSPTVVLIEDLHFAPAEGHALFAALAVAIRDLPVLLVGTARRGISAQWRADLERMGYARWMTLARLGARDVHRLLEDAMGTASVVGEVATKVALASDGNPYFVFEILRGLREQGILRKTSSGTWITSGVVRELVIPASVEDLLKARVAELDAQDRAFLEVAACLGGEFDPLLVAEALDEKAIPALQRLARLEAGSRLVRAKGRRFVFDHGQVKETLYEGIPTLLREQYHALLGATLEAREGAADQEPETLPGDLAVALTRHFLLGHEPLRSRRTLSRATSHLEGLYAYELAADLGDRALRAEGLFEGEARVDQLLAQAWRLEHLGRREEQGRAIEEAGALAESVGDAQRCVRADMLLSGFLWRTGKVEEGRAVITRAIERAAEIGDRVQEAGCRGNLGMLQWSRGEYEESLAENQKAMAMAREVGAWSVEANALGGIGNALWALGRIAEARDAQAQWLALAKEHGDRVGEAMAEGNLGVALRYLGLREEGRPHIERSLELARQIGHVTVAANAAVSLGGLCAELGRMEEAVATLESALRPLGDAQYRETEGVVLGMLGLAWLGFGVVDRAREYYARAFEVCTEIGDRRNLGYAIFGQGLIAEREGDRAAALERYGEATGMWGEIGFGTGLAPAHLQRGVLLAEVGRAEEGKADLEAALAHARETDQPGVEIATLAHLALGHGGAVDAALEVLAEHEGHLNANDAMTARFLLWKATRDPAHLAEAKRLLDHLVEHAPEAHRVSMVENVPFHRDIVKAWKERAG